MAYQIRFQRLGPPEPETPPLAAGGRARAMPEAPRRGRRGAAPPAAGRFELVKAIVDPPLPPRDELVFLLQTAAEVEHALLVQYLYAAYSLGGDQVPANKRALVSEWQALLVEVAREEMGHLVTVQAVLRMVGAAINLEREDYPFRSELYPFQLHLEPLSKNSLAKYLVAEMPAQVNVPELADILQRADYANDGVHPNRVGAVYERVIELLGQLDTTAVSDAGLAVAPRAEEWDRGFAKLIIRTPTTPHEAIEVIRAIAFQGEGLSGALDPDTHFGRFLTVFRAFPETGWVPTRRVPADPVSKSGPTPNPSEIVNPRSRAWAELSNVRYRMLLINIAHALSEPFVEGGTAATSDRTALIGWSFDEMMFTARIANLLVTLPRGDKTKPERAAPTFEMPYSLSLPDFPDGRWRMHADLLAQAATILETLSTGAPAAERPLLESIKTRDAEAATFIGERLQPQARALVELRLLPPLVIGRFGSSPDPLENYDLVAPDPTSYRNIVPAPTFEIDPATGSITREFTPAAIAFRDANGRVKPLAPFIELWARFDQTGDFMPVTLAHLSSLGLTPADVKWRVVAGNFKAARRTGKAADRIIADTGSFHNHAAHNLVGGSENFKAGKHVTFGHVRYIKPTERFPEIRMRIMPASGNVYGPKANDPLTVDDVYDSEKGGWDDHFDDDPNAPLGTFPAGTYEGSYHHQSNRYVSDGYVDDTCDGIIEASITWGGKALKAAARFAVGVPDFAPDSVHVRTLRDDLEQALLGPTLTAPPARDEVVDIVRRALDTVRLTNTAVANADQHIAGVQTNSTNQAEHESTEYDRAREPVFGQGKAPYFPVLDHHLSLAEAAVGGTLPISPDLIRSYDAAGDFSDAARRRMPALMRGSDTLELTLTRRQIEIVRHACAGTPSGTTPRARMTALINFFASMAPLHSHIPTDDGGFVSQLFADPSDFLAYLESAVAKGPLAGAELGKPLVVPGNPDASGLVHLIQRTDHPMHGPFSRIVPGINMTGVDILKDWIASLH